MNPLNHVAIIMDGNGRWGLKHKNSRNAGHRAGLNTVEKIIKQSIKNKIKFLTLFAFSTENWKRPKKEINYLFNLLLNLAEKKTSKNSKIQINLALNYGAKFELISAIKKLQKNKNKINEKNIEKFLYTKNIPDPDLMIRTGNTKRLSNFLLWQLAYSEIFFEKKMWPDFNDKDYLKIIKEYKNLKRNFGKI
jgi:undecaprenyl diphosphate synthase